MAQNMNRSMLRHEKGKSADFISERLIAFSLSVTFIILPCILRCAPNSLATAAVSRIERLAVNNLNFLSACKQTCSILCIPSRLWIFFDKNAPDETWRVFFSAEDGNNLSGSTAHSKLWRRNDIIFSGE